MRRQHRVYALFAFAWVLWMRTSVPGTPDKWQVVDSMTREDDCRSKAADRERQERLNVTATITFQCFPDTIDPRPKP